MVTGPRQKNRARSLLSIRNSFRMRTQYSSFPLSYEHPVSVWYHVNCSIFQYDQRQIRKETFYSEKWSHLAHFSNPYFVPFKTQISPKTWIELFLQSHHRTIPITSLSGIIWTPIFKYFSGFVWNEKCYFRRDAFWRLEIRSSLLLKREIIVL